MSLTDEVKNDINRSFKRLIEETDTSNKNQIIEKASNKISEQLDSNISEEFKNGLSQALNLIEIIENTDKPSLQKIGLAALEYLNDPWDIIPDLISDKGFLDDIYVVNKAIRLIKSEESSKEKQSLDVDLNKDNREYSEWVINKVGGAAGPHIAKRAKNQDIMNSYQRKALFDIGRNHLYGYDLTIKQLSFFESLIETAVSEGVLIENCPDSHCVYCSELKNIYKDTSIQEENNLDS